MTEKPKRYAVGIHVGADQGTVKETSAAIDRILASPAGTAEKVEALKALGHICSVNNTTITNTHVNVD